MLCCNTINLVLHMRLRKSQWKSQKINIAIYGAYSTFLYGLKYRIFTFFCLGGIFFLKIMEINSERIKNDVDCKLIPNLCVRQTQEKYLISLHLPPLGNISGRLCCLFLIFSFSFVCHSFLTSTSTCSCLLTHSFTLNSCFPFSLFTLLLRVLYPHSFSFAQTHSFLLPCLSTADPGSPPKGTLSSF